MPTTTITVRMPEPLYQWLRDRAGRENRSISRQVIQILQQEKNMNRYQVFHTVDQSGGRCAVSEGWLDSETTNLNEAIRIAEELTAAGQCGYVRRESDGAILAPDSTWIKN